MRPMAHSVLYPDYFTKDEVRAVLGVSTTELSDAQLDLPLYPIVVEQALEDIHASLQEDYELVKALPSPSTQQHKLLDAVKMYALYSLANHLTVSLPMFSVKSLTDGRAEFQRQTDVWKDTKDGILAQLNSMRYRLAAIYQGLYPGNAVVSSVSLSMLKAVGLAVDPVTGT